MLLESDAAVVDLHSDGHRVAFNKAFEVSLLTGTLDWETSPHYLSGKSSLSDVCPILELS